MKTIYIHIGTFKTGSTSIQRFLKENRAALESRGVYVPTTQLLAHHPLPLSLIKNYSRWRAGWREFEGGPDDVWDKFLDEVSKTECETILISSESFCDLVNENCRESSKVFGEYLKNKLQQYDVKIICYLRSIEPYIKSIYQESIKITSRTISMLQEVEELFQRDSIHLKPTIYLDFYSSLFGRENLIVKEYSRKKMRGGDSVEDILGILGCADLYQKESAIRSNPSLSIEGIKLKRALNACGLDSYEYNQEMVRLINLAKDVSEDTSFEEAIPRHIAREIETEQNEIEQRYGLRLTSDNAGELLDAEENTPSSYDLLVISLLSKIIAQNELIIAKGVNHRQSLSARIRIWIDTTLRKIGIGKR